MPAVSDDSGAQKPTRTTHSEQTPARPADTPSGAGSGSSTAGPSPAFSEAWGSGPTSHVQPDSSQTNSQPEGVAPRPTHGPASSGRGDLYQDQISQPGDKGPQAGTGVMEKFADSRTLPPQRQYEQAAREQMFEAARGSGVKPVTNVEFNVGNETLRGQMTLDRHNQQIFFDQDHNKYKVMPADSQHPQGVLQPLSRGRADSEPLPIAGSRSVPAADLNGDTRAGRARQEGTPASPSGQTPEVRPVAGQGEPKQKGPEIQPTIQPVSRGELPAPGRGDVQPVARPPGEGGGGREEGLHGRGQRQLGLNPDGQPANQLPEQRAHQPLPPQAAVPERVVPQPGQPAIQPIARGDIQPAIQPVQRDGRGSIGAEQIQHLQERQAQRVGGDIQPAIQPVQRDGRGNFTAEQIQHLQERQAQRVSGDIQPATQPVQRDGRGNFTAEQIQQIQERQALRVSGEIGRNLPGNVPELRPRAGEGLPGQMDGLKRGQMPNPSDAAAGVGQGGRGNLPHGGLDVPQQNKQAGPEGGILPPQLRDASARQSLLEAINQAQAGKVDLHNQKLLDALKEFKPDQLAQLKQFLQDAHGNQLGRLDTKFDITMQGKIKEIAEFLVPGGKRADGSDLSAGLPRLGQEKSPSERLLDFLRTNEKLIDKVPGPEASRALVQDLGKILKDYNQQIGLEPGKGALTVKDILGRNFEDAARAAERGLLPGQLEGRGEKREFTVKQLPGDEIVMRNLLDRVQSRSIADAEAAGRTRQETTRVEPLTGRLDPHLENIQQQRMEDAARSQKELGARVDASAARSADAIPQKNIDAATGTASPQPSDLRGDGRAPSSAPKEDAQTDQQLTTHRADKREDDEKKPQKKEDDKSRDEKIDQRMTDAALAALATKRRQEMEDKEKQETAKEKDKKEPERRVKYIVKQGDTLESIAAKTLRDKRLAGLIYEINQAVIAVRVQNGKKIVELEPKLVIWLPTPTEAKEYRGRLLSGKAAGIDFSGTKFASAEDELSAKFGTNWDGTSGGAAGGESLEDMAADAIAAAQARRANIERLLGPLSKQQEVSGKIKYVVRLGDSLKSIAMKHPALQDVSLWKLLAELNRLSTKVDEKGVPAASVRRGITLLIPSPEEIAAYRQREGLGISSSGGAVAAEAASASFGLPTKSCRQCGRATIVSAAICPGCNFEFEPLVSPAKAMPAEAGTVFSQTVPASDQTAAASARCDSGGDSPSHDRNSSGTSEEADDATAAVLKAAGFKSGGSSRQDDLFATKPVDKGLAGASTDSPLTGSAVESAEDPGVIEQLADVARLITSGGVEDLQAGFKSRLEVLLADTWVPVVAYEIYTEVSLRHEYKPDGQRKTIRIDLPSQAAFELARNDLASNWATYCDKFQRAKLKALE